MMTSQQRVLAAIRGDCVDAVPNMLLVKQFCTRQLGIPYLDYIRDHQVLVETQIQIQDRWPSDCFNVLGYAYREASDCGLPLTWLEDTVPHPEDVLIKSREDIRRIKWPDPWQGPLMRDRLQAIQLFKRRRPDIAVLGAIEACFAQALTFRGMQQAMMDLVLDPDLIRELMDFILVNEIAFAKAQVEAGADLIFIGDAAASLVGQPHYLEFILPSEQQLVAAVKELGVPAKLHICGNIQHILQNIAETGADIVDIDWMVDLKTARRTMGPRVCLCGNLDPVAILLHSDPETVREECRRSIKEAGAPFLLSPGCEIPPETPAENYAALCERYSCN
jgi:MtaA/CmuA family methyltransferase